MGLLNQIIGRLGGEEPIERLAREQVNFDAPQSPEFTHWNELVVVAPPEDVQDAMAQAARRVDAQEYCEHITPKRMLWCAGDTVDSRALNAIRQSHRRQNGGEAPRQH